MEDSREKLTRVSLENERKEAEDRDFPSSPVVKTSSFQCRGCRFAPLSGTKIPPACAVWQKKNKEVKLYVETAFKKFQVEK